MTATSQLNRDKVPRTKLPSRHTVRNLKSDGAHNKVAWNHSLLLKFLGSNHAAMSAKFADADLPAPSQESLTMWRHRRAIGADSLPLVCLALSRLNPQYVLRDLIVLTDETPPL